MGVIIKRSVILLLLILTVSLLSCQRETISIPTPAQESSSQDRITNYTYRIVNRYPHDNKAFTQGLTFENGYLYESTGLYGFSSIRQVDLQTGQILQIRALPQEYFGEGIAIMGDKIIQLTWQSHIGFIYNKHSFEKISDFSYATEGWGITFDGEDLIIFLINLQII